MPVQLHDIVLQYIFEDVMVPSAFLSATPNGRNGRWLAALRMKKAISLVCKQWHFVSLHHLYASITLTQVGQLFALTDTVFQNPAKFSELIKSITLCFLLPFNCTEAAYFCLTSLLKHCNRIPEYPMISILDLLRQEGARMALTQPTVTSNIQHLEVWYEVKCEDLGVHDPDVARVQHEIHGRTLLSFLSSFSQLTSLKLTLDSPIMSTHTPLTLLSLTDLTLFWAYKTFQPDVMPIYHALKYIANCKLPNLTAATLRQYWRHSEIADKDLRYLTEFFMEHGRKLIFLDVSTLDCPTRGSTAKKASVPNTIFSNELPAVIDLYCKSLKQLVVSLADFDAGQHRGLLSLLDADRPKIGHLDVWANPHLSQWTLNHERYAPFLRPRVRLFDESLSDLPNLPRSLPPDEDVAVRFHNVYGPPIVQTSWAVFEDVPPLLKDLEDWDGAIGSIPVIEDDDPSQDDDDSSDFVGSGPIVYHSDDSTIASSVYSDDSSAHGMELDELDSQLEETHPVYRKKSGEKFLHFPGYDTSQISFAECLAAFRGYLQAEDGDECSNHDSE
ncbi:hypothetical protein ABKN59_009272 [Abortiporus biennis]